MANTRGQKLANRNLIAFVPKNRKPDAKGAFVRYEFDQSLRKPEAAREGKPASNGYMADPDPVLGGHMTKQGHFEKKTWTTAAQLKMLEQGGKHASFSERGIDYDVIGVNMNVVPNRGETQRGYRPQFSRAVLGEANKPVRDANGRVKTEPLAEIKPPTNKQFGDDVVAKQREVTAAARAFAKGQDKQANAQVSAEVDSLEESYEDPNLDQQAVDSGDIEF